MQAVRLADGFTLAGFEVGDDRTIPVVGHTPADYATREDVIRARIAHLRHYRHGHLDDDAFRALLRAEGDPLARYAELPDWPLPAPKRALTLAEAEDLIASGDAEPVRPDLSMLDQGVLPWL